MMGQSSQSEGQVVTRIEAAAQSDGGDGPKSEESLSPWVKPEVRELAAGSAEFNAGIFGDVEGTS